MNFKGLRSLEAYDSLKKSKAMLGTHMVKFKEYLARKIKMLPGMVLPATTATLKAHTGVTTMCCGGAATNVTLEGDLNFKRGAFRINATLNGAAIQNVEREMVGSGLGKSWKQRPLHYEIQAFLAGRCPGPLPTGTIRRSQDFL